MFPFLGASPIPYGKDIIILYFSLYPQFPIQY